MGKQHHIGEMHRCTKKNYPTAGQQKLKWVGLSKQLHQSKLCLDIRIQNRRVNVKIILAAWQCWSIWGFCFFTTPNVGLPSFNHWIECGKVTCQQLPKKAEKTSKHVLHYESLEDVTETTNGIGTKPCLNTRAPVYLSKTMAKNVTSCLFLSGKLENCSVTVTKSEEGIPTYYFVTGNHVAHRVWKQPSSYWYFGTTYSRHITFKTNVARDLGVSEALKKFECPSGFLFATLIG